MSKFKNWKKIKKELNFTPEEKEEMKLEMELIEATIEARKKANLTQRDLSEKSGIIQPSIAKIERMKHLPQTTTLLKLLRPLGYTLKVVPLEKNDKRKLIQNRTLDKPHSLNFIALILLICLSGPLVL